MKAADPGAVEQAAPTFALRVNVQHRVVRFLDDGLIRHLDDRRNRPSAYVPLNRRETINIERTSV